MDAPIVILLPAHGENKNKNPILSAFTFMQTDSVDEQAYKLNHIQTLISIRHLHAEQILAYYLFSILNRPTNTPVDIGIQKLCCCTCYESLTKYFPNISIRGHHGQTYQGVIDLITGDLCEKSSECSRKTLPWPSPMQSPLKTLSRENRPPNLFTAPVSKKALDFSGGASSSAAPPF